MIPTRIDDDHEPDVIDLTVPNCYYGSLNFPIRPPTPFADNSLWPARVSEENHTNGMITWSSPTLQTNLDDKTNHNHNTRLSRHHSSSVSRSNSTWRRTITKFLKRTKSNEHRTNVSSRVSDAPYPYNFGVGEITRTDVTTPRSNGKRVHWIDDDEMILNLCHRFIEYLKLWVQNMLDNKNEDKYLKNCQITLDELDSSIDCQEIRKAFEDIVESAKQRNKTQLIEQQIYIENLLSRSVLLSSA
ncbi:unnamed protein product [Rotaria socialis]|uniref:Uncharacterized protein n=1 Tax=Rotaria socialis TaxID=392032 RepID=A0A820Y1E6_9BILA|nr:unnamed protein product [Rotaria socialis]CAF4536249.1 unnamed protein product [Rotaria socialis]